MGSGLLRALTAAVSLSVLALSGCVVLPGGPWQTATPLDAEEWGSAPAGSAVVGDCPWEPTPVPSPSVAAVDDPLATTEAVALDPERFWLLVESLPPMLEESDFQRAAGELAGCGMDDVIAFEARLTLALYALDGPDNLAWFEANDPNGLGFASDDVFLYARCATVLGGETAWERAVAEHTLEWGEDPPDVNGWAELLLYVSWDAAGALGLTVQEYIDLLSERIPLSYETGSNADLWGDLLQ
jgi:hypothetical protein